MVGTLSFIYLILYTYKFNIFVEVPVIWTYHVNEIKRRVEKIV